MRLTQLKQKWGAYKTYGFLLVIIIGLFLLGFCTGNTDFTTKSREIRSLKNSLNSLKTENATITKQLNIMRVELEVMNLAQQKNFNELKNGMEREKNLQKDIAFYQQVMAPELSQEGVSIETFNLEKSLSDRTYRFEIVLLQQEKIKSIIKGELEVTLVGSEGGQSAQYPLKALLVDDQKTLEFGFKYFQLLEGDLQLPEGFQPERIVVHADIFQFNRRKTELNSSFNWNVTNISE